MSKLLHAAWPAGGPPPAETLQAIDDAAAVLRRGGLVAIPTETVYGLAAIATDREAVGRIFEAKGRPSRNPLIVHVADVDAARALADEWPAAAERLADRFWPGPLTIVLRKRPIVPDIVTAGGDTVAVRCPAHPVTRRLLEMLGQPLAAPSANVSLEVSPTTAAHVARSLGDRIDMILDAGPCERGIESTVVDCSTVPPRILRPGPLDRDAIASAIGAEVVVGVDAATVLRSPGLTGRHYAPRAVLELSSEGALRVAELCRTSSAVGWITRGHAARPVVGETARLETRLLPDDPAGFAHGLYTALHDLDAKDCDVIVVDAVPASEAWRAVRDRLERAATRSP